MKFYPNNTMTQYTTRLMNPVELTGQWEVALVEVQFSKTWYTLPRHSGKIYFSCVECMDGININVPYGYYSNMKEVLNAMNEAVEETMKRRQSQVRLITIEEYKWPYFTFDTTRKQVNVVLQPGATVRFDEYLSALLGVSNLMENKESTHQFLGGSLIGDIVGGMNALYVYCDIVENVPVGDTEAPLLRIVDASGKNGEDIHRVFDKPRYVPLQKKKFESIEILIRNDIGEPVAFEGGRLTVTLHFQRAQNSYLLS
jgi:hypothetical protein